MNHIDKKAKFLLAKTFPEMPEEWQSNLVELRSTLEGIRKRRQEEGNKEAQPLQGHQAIEIGYAVAMAGLVILMAEVFVKALLG